MVLPGATARSPLELRVNGTTHRLDIDARRPLLYVLRDDLGLTGTKYGCGEGECGACTVLLDGRATHSCRLAAAEAAGREITTIEGLAPSGDALHPLQQAFIDAGAFQCGYCTPGMLLAAAALLRREPDPSAARIVAAMSGNICRCGTYPRIVAAIRQVATRTAAGGR